MSKLDYFARPLIYCLVLGIGFAQSALAHYPHDTHEFIDLSPDFVNDHTAFIASRQASSIRPITALVSRDAGASWEFNAKGMNNLGKLTSAIVSPLYTSDQTVFLTSEGQGVYRTVDGGLSWEKFNSGLGNLNLHASAAALDDLGEVTFFVSATNGGLYRLSPGASAWTQLLDGATIAMAFAVSPDFALDQTLLVGDQNGALLLSTDAGATFSQLPLSLGTGLASQIRFAPDYAASGEVFIGTTAGLFVSSDYLGSLSSLANFPELWISALALSPDYRVDGTLFFTTPTYGVFKSVDRGASWELNETGVGLVAQSDFHFYDLKMSSDYSSDGTIFLASFEGMFRSTDFGSSWVELETRPPSLIMSVAMSSAFAQDGLMLVSTYGGGIYITEDAGANWRVSNTGNTGPYIYQVAVKEKPGSDPVLLASHANHLMVSEDKGLSWVEKEISNVLPDVCIASKMAVSPNFANDATVFLGCRRYGIVVTRDAGETWSLAFDGQQLPGGSIVSLAISPEFATDGTLMFADQRGFFAISSDEGLNWQLTQNGLPTPGKWYGGRGLVFSPNYKNDGLVTAATENGLYASPDNASTWYLSNYSNSPGAQGVIENIAISPDFANDSTALTSVRGQGLFRFDNGGPDWIQVGSDGLDNRYDIQAAVFSPDFANDNLVIGWGHDRLFRSLDRADSFEPFDIPFVRHEESRKQSVLFNGNWYELVNGLASGSSYKVSATPGQEVSLLFVGTGVSWIGARANVLGKADVYIDDVLVATVDQYSDVPALQQDLYRVENLPLGTHEIRLVVTGSKNPAALANWVLVDAFDVTR